MYTYYISMYIRGNGYVNHRHTVLMATTHWLGLWAGKRLVYILLFDGLDNQALSFSVNSFASPALYQ